MTAAKIEKQWNSLFATNVKLSCLYHGTDGFGCGDKELQLSN